MGMPRSRKYSSTSTGVGAAPATDHSTWSSPSFWRMPCLTSSGRPAGFTTPCFSSAALIFSHTRGTPPQTVGRTSGRCATTCFGSATDVTVHPKHIEA
jgi:hypothetical protein